MVQINPSTGNERSVRLQGEAPRTPEMPKLNFKRLMVEHLGAEVITHSPSHDMSGNVLSHTGDSGAVAASFPSQVQAARGLHSCWPRAELSQVRARGGQFDGLLSTTGALFSPVLAPICIVHGTSILSSAFFFFVFSLARVFKTMILNRACKPRTGRWTCPFLRSQLCRRAWKIWLRPSFKAHQSDSYHLNTRARKIIYHLRPACSTAASTKSRFAYASPWSFLSAHRKCGCGGHG